MLKPGGMRMLYGVAAAATQVEGCQTNTNWYRWYQQGHIADGSAPSVATMHWEKWREDTELAIFLIFILVGYIIYRKKYRLDEETFEQIVSELRARGEIGEE